MLKMTSLWYNLIDCKHSELNVFSYTANEIQPRDFLTEHRKHKD